MNKEEFVKSLKNVKLVIGNGFDLHCGLHTKYSDFYCKYVDFYSRIRDLFESYKKTETLIFEQIDISSWTVWDVFFVLNSPKDPKTNSKKWCDIEKMMLSSLVRESDFKDKVEYASLSLCSIIHWPTIKECVVRNLQATNHYDRFVVGFIKEKMKTNSLGSNSFYSFLLSELKDFEKRFGIFIYDQLHEKYFEISNFGEKAFWNRPYLKMAMSTIGDLCNIEQLTAIDSFNYGTIGDERVIKKIQNINGDIESPIFGIDTIFEPKDERFIFTKTARRMDRDLLSFSHEAEQDFENIVIFGHSLNKADYSYFFPLFDKMRLTDPLANGVIVFSFDVYESGKEESIRAQQRESVSELLYEYATEKGLANPKRFLDSLSTQKRVMSYEIFTLKRELFGFSTIDKEWDDIYKRNHVI